MFRATVQYQAATPGLMYGLAARSGSFTRSMPRNDTRTDDS